MEDFSKNDSGKQGNKFEAPNSKCQMNVKVENQKFLIFGL